MTLTEMVKDKKKARFSFYRDRELWYKTDDGFDFPIPISDIGNSTFSAEHNAIELMKWIRKQLEVIKKEKAEIENYAQSSLS